MANSDRKQIRIWFDIETGPSEDQINLADWVLCWAESAYKRRGDEEKAERVKTTRWLLPRRASDLDVKETTNG